MKSLNAHLDQCLCVYCDKIVIGPVIFKQCEHAACRACFLDKNFKKSIKETVCFKCSSPIASETDLYVSGFLQKCIDNLQVRCDRGRISLYICHLYTNSGVGSTLILIFVSYTVFYKNHQYWLKLSEK